MTPATGIEQRVATLPAREVHRRLAGLRRHAAPHHAAVEAGVDIVGRLQSRDRYLNLLARLHGFYAPFEARIARAAGRWDLPIDVEARQKAPLLRLDLQSLGLTPTAVDELPRCDWLPAATTPGATLGCLYVVEGATLGGQLIARVVQEQLGIGPRNGGSFFHGYGSGTGPRWRTFCSVLAAATRSGEAESAVVASAVDTFHAYERWLGSPDQVAVATWTCTPRPTRAASGGRNEVRPSKCTSEWP
jgi:heme oxygenase (biliverdin-IX-beta and delta-forming)